MNDHAEIPSLPEADALEPVAPKPRRRRAAPAAEQTDVTAVEAKPKRRRAGAPEEARPDVAETGAQQAEVVKAAPVATDSAAQQAEVARAAPVATTPSASVASRSPAIAEPHREGAAAALTNAPDAPDASAAASSTEAEPVQAATTPAGEAADDAAGRSGRGRRRGRRHRDRGAQLETPEAEGASADAEGEGEGKGEGEDAAAAAPLPKVEAGVVFADVLSGVFDVATEAPAEESAVPRRVLRPEPDAPKLQKVLAQAGIGSRRDMEELILDGQITVNGEPAHIGQRISFGDQVKVSGKPVRLRIVPPPPRLIAYHKPAGEIVTHDDPQNRPTVFRRLPRLQQGKWQSVGRLDINTEGLLLFTNSGSLANQLMHPRFGVEREYAVRVLGTLSAEAREELLEGVEIEGQEMAFRSIEEGGGDGANRWYRVVITEGRNREVRKLFEAVGLTVSRLIRIRYGNIVLPPGLKRGVWVDLDAEDVRAIRRLAGGDTPRETRQGGRGNERGGRNNRGPRGERQEGRPNEHQRGNRARPAQADERRDERDPDDLDIDEGPIPNPLEQTFDKRFVQNPRSPAGGRGFGRGGGGFGQGGSAPPSQNRGSGPRQPDPLQTSVGYIGGDAYHRKGKGGRGGNRGGGGGFGGGGGSFGGGGRRGR
jgi:23S rRNA pseudouridine2605 synthase